ncbi:peroxidase 10-like [Nicotiana tabacum]|uniref:Peroxidase n=2 Tax=Nicotiana TaxID=4085 RepID=A0A1S4D5V6_TOBAC|nr:PREDICTED: peroxidase 10-like [Nicotiana sylvestris]XP_016508723.1 PREDICTED: peroxidase 10-like [Nicotiana tabacum]
MGRNMFHYLTVFFCVISILAPLTVGQLDYSFYERSCPSLPRIVRWGVWSAYRNDSRIAAALLRLHFHDCFVNGCDGSVLLDDTNDFKGEKNALPNRNSARGYEIIDSIKADLERACPSTVSCVDILTLAAREVVVMSGGPYWPVLLGRRDGLTASDKAANEQLPSPFEPLDKIAAKFTAKGLDLKDIVVLSGAHTIGYAQCFTFKRRLFNFQNSGKPDPNLDSSMLSNLQSTCPNRDESNSKIAPLDFQSVSRFDNSYYRNLVNNSGLLESDQALMSNSQTADMVKSYSSYPYLFYQDFAASMLKLGNVGVLTGQSGQIRKICGSVN